MRGSSSAAFWVPAVTCLAALTGCGGFSTNGAASGPVSLSISSSASSVPVNGTATLTATVSGSGNPPVWSIVAGGGSLSPSSGTTVVYTAPATPPVFGPAGQGGSSVQGIVTLSAQVFQGFGGASKELSLPITAPAVTTGIAPGSASLALGGTVEFYGYAVGSTNNQITWQVNGVGGGSSITGTIVNVGYYPAGGGNYVWPGTYTAPATMPMSGNTVTVSVVSVGDMTKSSSAVVTLH